MGSRQRPKPHQRADKHGSSTGQAGAGGQSRAQRRTMEEEQRRDEEATLEAAREDVDEPLPADEPAADHGRTPGAR